MSEKDTYLVVNATALDRSGALSILKQFIENIPVDNHEWLIFIPDNVSLSSEKTNIRLVPISGVKPMHKRLWWDCFGLNKWLQKHQIDPLTAISLQNTGFNVGKKVPTYIYYHQPLPFYPYNWSLVKKQERIFWFYKKIYPFFVKLFLKKDTKVFVQLGYIKDGFAKRFKHSKDLIEVYCPSVSIPENISVNSAEKSNCLKLIYPAMPHFYKNHKVIVNALKMTKEDISVLFTINSSGIKFNDRRIELIGMQPYERIFELYRDCDALLFPSYIETFGLPLLEAALTGMPIIAADLPYAREVLDGYEGVTFVQYNIPSAWSAAIHKLEKGKRYCPIDVSKRKGWPELFKSILSNINGYVNIQR